MSRSSPHNQSLLSRCINHLAAILGIARFRGSADYWEQRYARGGDSGRGSYGKLAEFKAEVINGLIREYAIRSLVEFGCGDGNQLNLLNASVNYIGLDISTTAIIACQAKFRGEQNKQFIVYQPANFLREHPDIKADLSMSIDVLYHLVEDNVFEIYMQHLFGAACRQVLIYSTDGPSSTLSAAHVRHRPFSRYVATHFQDWRLSRHIPNKYPLSSHEDGSDAEFFLFTRAN